MCRHLEALGAECVLTGEHLVQVTQLLQADRALKEVRQVHALELLILSRLASLHSHSENVHDSKYIFLLTDS